MIDPATAARAAAIDAFLANRAVGMITAERPECDATANRARSAMLAQVIGRRFGLLRIEARRLGIGAVEPLFAVQHAFLVIGPPGDDHGQVRGFLRTHGARFDQDATLFKAPHASDVELTHLLDASTRSRSAHNVGPFGTLRLDEFYGALRGHAYDPAMLCVGLKTRPRFFSRQSVVFSPAKAILLCKQ